MAPAKKSIAIAAGFDRESTETQRQAVTPTAHG
jgi:hypothetical protein